MCGGRVTATNSPSFGPRGLERFSLRRSNAVTAVLGVVRALVWREEGNRPGDQIADVPEVPRSRGAEERFEFGEGLLDRIEVRAVRRKELQECAGLFNRDADIRLFVRGQVIEHDDIAWAQCGDEDLLDVGAEGVGIDGPIEHGRRGQLGGTKRGDDRMRLPVAARRVIADARAAKAPRVTTDQISGDARLINEDVLSPIVEWQRVMPAAPGRGDVRATLFVGVYGFF